MHNTFSRYFQKNTAQSRTPWPISRTLVWSIVIGAVFVAVQSGIVSLYFAFWEEPAAYENHTVRLASVQSNSTLISVMAIANAVVCGGLIVLLVIRSGAGLRDYLALKTVRIGTLSFWLLVLLGFSLASNLVASLFEEDIVTDFARDLYKNTGNVYLLAFAIVVAGPFLEELFFRGFLFRGLADSRLQVVGAILVTTLIWTLIHGQYDWYVKANIFFIGILFGYARHRSKSLFPPLVMHMTMNAMALVEVAQL